MYIPDQTEHIMNYHLMTDEKFIDGFINLAEKVSPGKNKYVYTFEGPPLFIKYTSGVQKPIGSDELSETLSSLTENDRLFIHWFTDDLMQHLSLLKPNVPVYLLFWGGDFLEQPAEFVKFNLEPETYKIVDFLNHRSMFYFTLNPVKIVKQLASYFTVNQRWDEYRSNAVKVRKIFMQRLNYFCHWNEADLHRVTGIYGGKPVFKKFFYDFGFSNFADEVVTPHSGDTKLIWLGNSATFPNNHADALMQLKQFHQENIKIVAPLSYGHLKYGRMISKLGKRYFKDKFYGMEKFIPLNEYLELLKDVDVVVMYHNRTQAGVNVFAFLRMGKKVFLKKESTIYSLAVENGIKVFDANLIGTMSYEEFITPLSYEEREQNRKMVSDMFSEENRHAYMQELLN